MGRAGRRSLSLLLCGLAAACQSTPNGPGNFSLASSDAALPVMERIALTARECWFRSGDPQFAEFRMAPELVSFSGRPRILLVPRNNPNGLPLAVIEATGTNTTINVYGPALARPVGNRIRTDVARWSAGPTACI